MEYPAGHDGFSLIRKTVIVTGGAMGIGSGITEILAEAGAKVIVADINSGVAADGVAQLRSKGLDVEALAVDLGDPASIEDAVATMVKRHGVPWGLVNNAGVQDRELLLEGSAEEWDRMNAINGRGPFLMTREVAKAMVAAKTGGRIVNIGSSSLVGQLVFGLSSYVGSKGAVLAFSRAAAMELAHHDITVNVVNPGGVFTPGTKSAKGPAPEGPALRTPPLGYCEPRDIAGAVLYFLAPLSARVTNQVITVDGGWTTT